MSEIYQRDDWRELKAHEAAEAFPMMTDEQLADIVEDLRTSGFDRDEPVILLEGLILDGRCRLRGCELAGVEPWFRDYDGEADLEKVVRLNMNRRHMNPSQLAMAAATLWPIFAARAKERQRKATGGDRKSEAYRNQGPVNLQDLDPQPRKRALEANAELGKVFGIGASYVDRAKRIQKEAPGLAVEVRDKGKTIHAAWKELQMIQCADFPPDLAEQVRAGEKTAGAALTERKSRKERERMSASDEGPKTKSQLRRQKKQEEELQKRTTKPAPEGAPPLCQTNTYGLIGTFDKKAASRIAMITADPGLAASTIANHFDRNAMGDFLIYLHRYLDAETVGRVLRHYGKEKRNVGMETGIHRTQ